MRTTGELVSGGSASSPHTRACLYRAGFSTSGKERLTFQGAKELNTLAGGLDPTAGLTPEEAAQWFTVDLGATMTRTPSSPTKKAKGKEWADEELKAMMVMLTKKTKPRGAANVSGFTKLRRRFESITRPP